MATTSRPSATCRSELRPAAFHHLGFSAGGEVYSSYFAVLSMGGPSTEESDSAWHVRGLPGGL
jgi:hypothetical protein